MKFYDKHKSKPGAYGHYVAKSGGGRCLWLAEEIYLPLYAI
jgi:hypothetical protein